MERTETRSKEAVVVSRFLNSIQRRKHPTSERSVYEELLYHLSATAVELDFLAYWNITTDSFASLCRAGGELGKSQSSNTRSSLFASIDAATEDLPVLCTKVDTISCYSIHYEMVFQRHRA